MRMTFQEVAVHAGKSGICPRCGKRASRSEKFYQTLNPFNKNADGHVKDSSEIRAELMDKRAAWKAEPVYHAKCEYAIAAEKRGVEGA